MDVMSVLRLVWGRMVGDRGRTLASVGALALATAMFVTLSSGVASQSLMVRGTVAANSRGAYDLLVRPAGTTLSEEQQTDLVRPNFLSGQYGGISQSQLEAIRGIEGVDVAAPVAMVGVAYKSVKLRLDVTDLVPRSGRVLWRTNATYVARRGHEALGPIPFAFYVTDEPLERVVVPLPDGGTSEWYPAERINGTHHHHCGLPMPNAPGQGCYSRSVLTENSELRPDEGYFIDSWISYPMVIAAIDPVSESRLMGLDRAVVAGRPLTEDDKAWEAEMPVAPSPDDDASSDNLRRPPTIPALFVSRQDADFHLQLDVSDLGETAAEQFATAPSDDMSWTSLESVHKVVSKDYSAADIYSEYLSSHPPSDERHDVSWNPLEWDATGFTANVAKVGPVEYKETEPLRPRGRGPLNVVSAGTLPVFTRETYRSIESALLTSRQECSADSPNSCYDAVDFQPVGVFDPDLLTHFSELAEVPDELYRAPVLQPRDEETLAALGKDGLLPDLSPVGYVSSPATVLIAMAALPELTDRLDRGRSRDPISSVRVRVNGVTELDAIGRERIRQIAETIHFSTGLDVDITMGSSPVPRQLLMPSRPGQPDFNLDEWWTKKGVAVVISEAIDRKSVLLSWLVMGTAILTISMITHSATRAGARDRGVLVALGWRSSRLVGALLAEQVLVGAAAGTLAVLMAPLIVRATGSGTPMSSLALCLPVSIVASLGAGMAALPDTLRTPIIGLRPQVSQHMPSHAVRGPAGLASVSLLRRPVRTIVTAMTMAGSVAALGLLVGILRAFNGAVVGSLLGDTVALRVRQPDIWAVVFLSSMALVAMSTTVYLNVREDLPDLAVLSACGWRDALLARTVIAQAAIVGSIGSVLGLALAAVLAHGLFQADAMSVLPTAATAAACFLPPSLLGGIPSIFLLRHTVGALRSE